MKITDFLKPTEAEFRKKLYFQAENLQSHIEKLPLQSYDVGRLFIKASEEYEESKRNLEQAWYNAYKFFKKKYENKKVSEKEIESMIRTHSTYLKAQEQLIKIKGVYDVFKNEKDALNKKGKMLELLVKNMEMKSYNQKFKGEKR